MSNKPSPLLSALMSRFSDTQLLMPMTKAGEFQGLLQAIAASDYAKLVVEGQTDHVAASDDFWGDNDEDDDSWKKHIRPYNVLNGILQIPIRGVLLNNFPYQLFGYATGYSYIWEAFKRGMNDDLVKGIAFIIHSGGGEVAGNFDLVDRMYAYRGKKPVRAFAHEYAYSAAYSIGSVADHIVVSRSGGVGSIGVVTSHLDMSKMYDDIGLKVTFIHFGDHKVDGNPYNPLPKDVKDRIQGDIDRLGMEFVSIVVRNRDGKIDEKGVIATQALTYSAQEAITIGLADSVGPLDDALVIFESDLNTETEEETMAMTPEERTTHEAAVAAAAVTGKTEGKAEGLKEGMDAGKARISTILAGANAKTRPKAAMSAAMNTDMTPAQAEAFLGGMDEEKPVAAVTTTETAPAQTAEQIAAAAAAATTANFTEAMGKDQPNVGADVAPLADANDMGKFAKDHGIAGY